MSADFTPYEAVTEELEEAERQAAVRALRTRSPAEPESHEDDLVLRWVKEFQTQRLFMHLMLLDLAEVHVEGDEISVALSPDVTPELMDELSARRQPSANGERPEDR